MSGPGGQIWVRFNAHGRVTQLSLGLASIFLVLTGGRTARATPTVRVVEYNIEADVNGNTAPNTGLYTVLEAIGENYVGGAAHPLDIMSLEETTSNAATVAPIVAALNSYYGAGTYATSAFQAAQSGNATTGNGPNAIIYNTTTLALLASVGVGTPAGSTNGEYRQVARYEFQPVGGAVGTQFYVYVSHMKSSSSGSSATNQKYRGEEATIISNDILALPANGGVLAMGDFNMDGSTEAAYKTLTGTAGLIDPLNTSNNYNETWNSNTYLTLLTESDTSIHYRDDIQFMSPAVYNGTSTTGLHYVSGSCNIFGNNGTTAFETSVNQNSNTALNGLQGPISASAALTALTTASDHLPVVCDYTVASTVPATPYGTWQAAHFSPAELANPAISGDDADPDGDGIVNLMEYALNLDPRTPGVSGLPAAGITTAGGNSYLTLTYTQVIGDTDVSYVPQVSGDLTTWNSGTGAVATLSTTANSDGTTETVVTQDLTPESGTGSRFMRLMITHP